MSRYKRKIKPLVRSKPSKLVRVDSHTVIETDYDIPDHITKERYELKQLHVLATLQKPIRSVDFFR